MCQTNVYVWCVCVHICIQFGVGDVVEIVVSECKSDDRPPSKLKKGWKGVVKQIDRKGDANILFTKKNGAVCETSNWIVKKNFSRLKKAQPTISCIQGAFPNPPPRMGSIVVVAQVCMPPCSLLWQELPLVARALCFSDFLPGFDFSFLFSLQKRCQHISDFFNRECSWKSAQSSMGRPCW